MNHQRQRASADLLMNLETLARLRPDDPSLRLQLGTALLDAGQAERAGVHLRRAAALAPEEPDAWAGLGRWLRGSGRPAAARDAFARAGGLRAGRLAGSTPVHVALGREGATVGWHDLGGTAFTDPFFSDTVQRARGAGAATEVVTTDIEELAALQRLPRGLRPTAFIFHVSRCGSTLVSRLLATAPEVLVLAEPDPLNDLLSAAGGSEEDRDRWFRYLVGALGHRRLGPECRYVVKFSSWHLLEAPFVRRAFPEVPCVFLYRDPVEVMVSALRKPTGWMRLRGELPPVARDLGLLPGETAALGAEEFCARGLACLFRVALEAFGDDALWLNYSELPDAVWGRLSGFLGLPTSAQERRRMADLARYDAKEAGGRRPFSGDRAAKQEQASGLVRELAGHWLSGLYEAAERRRREGPAGSERRGVR